MKKEMLLAALMLGMASSAFSQTKPAAKADPPAKVALPKPTTEAIAAAKEALQAIVSRNERDYDRAEAKLKIEVATDMHANAVLFGDISLLHMKSMSASLPLACVGAVNKQLRAGEWPGMPDSCSDKK